MSNQEDNGLAEKITAQLEKQGIKVDSKKEEPKNKALIVEPVVAKMETTAVTEDSSEVESEEDEARRKGWKPDGPKSAGEFLRSEPLYTELKQRVKEIKALRAQMDEAIKHISNLKKAGYQEKLDVIKQERANAIIRSDIESVDYLDQQLHQVKAELQQEEQYTQPEIHPAAVAFLEKYQDVLQDPAVQSYVRKKDIALGNDPDVSDPYDHMKKLEEQLFKKYPDKFEAQDKQEQVMAVESDSRPVTNTKRSKTKHGFGDLNQVQKKIYSHLIKHGGSGEKYIKELVEMGELN